MNIFLRFRRWALLACALVLTGCATQKTPFDYAAFKASQPRSILVLPPLNNTPDVRASYSVLAQVTYPLAESGYYVIPVALMEETFRENGIQQASDAHDLPINKLREIFGADAGMYITVTQYGTKYQVVDSVTMVAAEGKLVDLRTGTTLWTGKATASSAEQQNQQQGGLAGMLVTAMLKQMMNTITDKSHPMAGLASQRLLRAGSPNGLLYGPRSPKFTPN